MTHAHRSHLGHIDIDIGAGGHEAHGVRAGGYLLCPPGGARLGLAGQGAQVDA